MVKFSFVIGTLNRANELNYCLESLFLQDYKNFEIIIIDQSKNNLTEKLIKSYHDKRIIYRHVKFKGLSRARNVAIAISTGDYICLTDDDAYYSMNYLTTLKKYYSINPNTIITGYMWDAVKKKDFIDYSNVKEGKPLTIRQIIRFCPSPALTFPKSIFDSIGGFDDNFGVGAKYGAGEETDFLLRAVWNKYNILHFKDVKVEHPHKYASIAVDENAEIKKANTYPYGIGAMYKKHFLMGYESKMIFPYIEQILKMYVKRMLGYENAEIIFKKFREGFSVYGK